MPMLRLMGWQMLPWFGKRDRMAAVAEREADAVAARADTTVLDLVTAGRRSYYGLLLNRYARAINREQRAIVDTVVRTQAHFLGPIPKTEANIRLLKALGGGVPANALVVPILAIGRIVNVFYADGGKGALVDAGGVGELLILATRIAKSYDALLERVR
jgi:hypothetical protein